MAICFFNYSVIFLIIEYNVKLYIKLILISEEFQY
jgi:hypothetical protein